MDEKREQHVEALVSIYRSYQLLEREKPCGKNTVDQAGKAAGYRHALNVMYGSGEAEEMEAEAAEKTGCEIPGAGPYKE